MNMPLGIATSTVGLTLGIITAIVGCCVRLKHSILEHTFGSGLVAGDSFQRLSPRAIRQRRREQRLERANRKNGLIAKGQGIILRALSASKIGKQAVESADAGLTLAIDRIGGEIFRSRGDLSLQMTPLSEAVPEPLTDELRRELRAGDVQGLNFSGRWEIDRRRSSSLDLHLEALGLPWLARQVAAHSNYSCVIDHQGLWWQETSTTAVVTTTNEFRLDGRKQSEPHPMDKSECICQTRVEAPSSPVAHRSPAGSPLRPNKSAATTVHGPSTPIPPLDLPTTAASSAVSAAAQAGTAAPSGAAAGGAGGGKAAVAAMQRSSVSGPVKVVTRTSYLKHGHSQVVSRWLEDGGETYVVANDLSLVKKGVVLQATLYFTRVHDTSSDEEKEE